MGGGLIFALAGRDRGAFITKSCFVSKNGLFQVEIGFTYLLPMWYNNTNIL